MAAYNATFHTIYYKQQLGTKETDLTDRYNAKKNFNLGLNDVTRRTKRERKLSALDETPLEIR